MKKLSLAFVFFWMFHLSAMLVWAADILEITNNAKVDLLDIQLKTDADKEIFIRLDLQPHTKANFENPDIRANIRLDTGLELIYYNNINFSLLEKIFFDEDHALKLEGPDLKKLQFPDKLVQLVPQKGEKPVCELANFAPRMPMLDVCKIIPETTPKDDNGALLAGLGFGGLTWGGRLAPEQDKSEADDILLEHIELRRKFAQEDLNILLQHLASKHYVPWQCEFPHATLDFADMPDKNQDDRMKSLNDVLSRYLATPSGKRGEAIIMFAPENNLSALANADEPEKDVQLYTIVLKPDADLLLLDVAAYEAQKTGEI